MKGKKGFTLIELLVVIAIIAILAAILFPVFVRAKQAALASHCQSNLNQIGKSIKMYLSDWEDTYPTNRLNPPMNTFIAQTVPLSDPNLTDSSGDPIRYEYGVNWVEELYPYTEKVLEGDAASAWKCPAAKTVQYGGTFAAVTYAFNANLVEMSEGIVKSAGNVMMCRELDRLMNAVLKPAQPTPNSSPAPINPFLNQWEMGPVMPKYKLHAEGSTLLFADGHVKAFPVAYFPQTCQWNPDSSQWFNFVTSGTDEQKLSIAISP